MEYFAELVLVCMFFEVIGGLVFTGTISYMCFGAAAFVFMYVIRTFYDYVVDCFKD